MGHGLGRLVVISSDSLVSGPNNGDTIARFRSEIVLRRQHCNDQGARKWLKKLWIDLYSGKGYRITTMGHYGMRNTARVKTYGDALAEYEITQSLNRRMPAGRFAQSRPWDSLPKTCVHRGDPKHRKGVEQLGRCRVRMIHDHRNVCTEYPGRATR